LRHGPPSAAVHWPPLPCVDRPAVRGGVREGDRALGIAGTPLWRRAKACAFHDAGHDRRCGRGPQPSTAVGWQLLALAVLSATTLFELDRRAGHAREPGIERYVERFSPNTITALLVGRCRSHRHRSRRWRGVLVDPGGCSEPHRRCHQRLALPRSRTELACSLAGERPLHGVKPSYAADSARFCQDLVAATNLLAVVCISIWLQRHLQLTARRACRIESLSNRPPAGWASPRSVKTSPQMEGR
jgi:hypothetical protein